MPDPRTQIVADGYDAMGETFAAWRQRIVGDPRREWEKELASRLSDGDRVLELGCGAGTPETKRLAERFATTGVDISPRHGWLLTAFGQSDNPGWTGEWLGAQTFFASFPPEVNSRLVREAGFTVERDEVVTFEEPEGPARFQWVLAQA